MNPSSGITPWDLECMLCDETAEPKALPLSFLEEITDGFSDKQRIGTGGFAVVYKGKLENMTVAVKRMSSTYMYEKEFQREVECLMMVKHKNVVRFLGYCADTQGNVARYEGKFVMADVQQRLLCFEYLPKGSLREYITDAACGLRWRDRYQIITGICQGLHYLHQKNIVHLDLKPANILLDDNWIAKITDFGISRCFHEIESQVITKIAGTPGYLAPESFNHTEVTYRHSYRLDIYSLGVVIMEILTGKKGYHDVDEVVESWSNLLEISQSEIQLEQVRVCTEIGIECTNFNPEKRPDTQDIINRLDETECMEEHTETDVITLQQIYPDMLDETMHSLWLNYQQLNQDIKRCIEYCSIFPKGSRLRMNDLVRLWIAQGFVKTRCVKEDIEDVAEGYLQELVSYSLLQPEQTWGGTKIFTIHDVLHDILDKVAKNCFRIENVRRHRGKGWEGDVPRDVEHLFVQNYDGELITEKIIGLEHLRTLIVYAVEKETIVEKEVFQSICKRLLNLRVLAIAFSQDRDRARPLETFSVPKSISQLKHLCYLAFRTEWIHRVRLPSTLNKLRRIQVLDFGDCNDVNITFPDLINLRHLICGLGVKLHSLEMLTSLRAIRNFRVRDEVGYDLKQLKNLNKLRGSLVIQGLGNVKSKQKALEANLAAKERLTCLKLEWDYSDRNSEVAAEVLEGLCPPLGLQTLEIYEYRGSRFPDWMAGKKNCGPMELKELKFSVCRSCPLGLVHAEAFPHLCVLTLDTCNWKALPVNMEHLTSLKKLKICSCSRLRSLPTLPQSLEEFHLKWCDDGFMTSCITVGHQHWQNIQHIPKKCIVGISLTTRMKIRIRSGINRLRGIWRRNTA